MHENKNKLVDMLKRNKAKTIYVTLTACILIVSTLALFFTTSIIRITDGEISKVVLSTFRDKEKLLDIANIEVEETDKILYTSYDGNYKNLTIQRGFEVPITVDDSTITAHITQGTVADCLANAQVVLGEFDYTEPSLHTPINEGDSIRVYRVKYIDNQYEESIPYKTEYRQSSLTYRFPRRSYTLSEGREGTNLVTYRERYVDGEMDLALVSNVETIKKPVNKQVLSYGKGVPVSPLSAPEGVSVVNGVPTGYSRMLTGSSTGYYSKKGGKGASGLGLFYGSVAVDPNVIPYGTKMYIASPDGKFVYGWAIATDTGAAVTNGSALVDLYYETYLESSLNWRNEVNVYIYG